MTKLMITGANGTIGIELVKHLKQHYDLILADIDFSDFPEELKESATIVEKNLSKVESWDHLLDDVEYVIQLAGNPDAGAEFYEGLLDLNYKLPQNLYGAAEKSDTVKRIIFASSIHASDAYPDNVQVKTSEVPRPDDLYGVSKVFLEALASYYAYKKGIESIGIRIGDYKSPGEDVSPEADFYSKGKFFTYRDMNHLIDCCLKAELVEEPYLLVNGISNNSFPRLDIDQARVKLGYQPQDNAFES